MNNNFEKFLKNEMDNYSYNKSNLYHYLYGMIKEASISGHITTIETFELISKYLNPLVLNMSNENEILKSDLKVYKKIHNGRR